MSILNTHYIEFVYIENTEGAKMYTLFRKRKKKLY